MLKVIKISKFSEFIDEATNLSGVIFRGQTKDWSLVPSVGRDDRRSLFLRRESETLEEFKREARPFIDGVPTNDWQWLALAQHNRLPTCLLDWTRNSLAALWFAVKDCAIDNQPGAVWAYHYKNSPIVSNTTRLDSPLFPPSPFSINRIHVYFPEHVFPSIQAQSGVFTVHHKEGPDPGEFPPLEKVDRDADILLIKMEIKPDLFSIFRYQLFRVGISPASLYPGLSGLVDRIRYDNTLCKDEPTT